MLHGEVDDRGHALAEFYFQFVEASGHRPGESGSVCRWRKQACETPIGDEVPIDGRNHAAHEAVAGTKPGVVYDYRLVAVAGGGLGCGAGLGRRAVCRLGATAGRGRGC